MTMPRVVVVDYKMSNIFSIVNVFKHIGVDVIIAQSSNDIKNADALVLPGVGAFGEAMNNLYDLQLIEPILHFIKSGKPFLGICLGLQLLFSDSSEFGIHRGLAVIPGKVIKFPESFDGRELRVPSVGWNQIDQHAPIWESSPLQIIKDKSFMYFVHSFYVKPDNNECIASYTTYNGFNYCSSIYHENIFAAQFHPEKSGKNGIQVLFNWLNYIQRNI